MLVAIISIGFLGCALEQGAGDSERTLPISNDEAWAVTEEWRDSCRRWCGIQDKLTEVCNPGEAIIRGVPLGKPLPATVTKSYDLACIDECLTPSPSVFRCWRQEAEWNDCYASEALYVCHARGGWGMYGCGNAGEDPSICDEP